IPIRRISSAVHSAQRFTSPACCGSALMLGMARYAFNSSTYLSRLVLMKSITLFISVLGAPCSVLSARCLGALVLGSLVLGAVGAECSCWVLGAQGPRLFFEALAFPGSFCLVNPRQINRHAFCHRRTHAEVTYRAHLLATC